MSSTQRFWSMILVLALSAVAFHVLPHGERMPPTTSLNRLPRQLGNWSSVEVPLDERIVKVAGVDEYINRFYLQDGLQPVSLYVGFYRSQRTGDTIHSPKNCLPGAGWQPITSTRVGLREPTGSNVPVNLYIVAKEADRQIVLYWYQSHGRIIASEYSAKLHLVMDAIRLNRTDGSLVRITTPIQGNPEESQRRIIAFAQEILPSLDEVLPR